MSEPARSRRVLLCGLCPLPFENTSQNYGPGIRTWQLARGLQGAGHRVAIAAMIIPRVYARGELRQFEEVEGIPIHRMPPEEFMEPGAIEDLLTRYQPELLVGATIYGSLALAQTDCELPLWADQFGHVMAEAQAKASLEEENWPLPHWWRMVETVMSRADKVSTVSERQRYAAIGELGALGRLTWESCGYEFTAVIPCALVPEEGGPPRPAVRGKEVPEDAFILLWSGGFNVWTDVETLFAGVDGAMGEASEVHLVATGGAIAGHDTSTYARFLELVRGSKHRARYHLQGWVKRERVSSYVAEADLGVLTDRPMYEGILGSKNRIVQWLAAGLPAAYNRVGDIGDYLTDHEIGLTFPVGDAEGLTEAIFWAAGHPGSLEEMAARGRDLAFRDFSFEATTGDLIAWASQPTRAPDAHHARSARSPRDFDPQADAEAKASGGGAEQPVRRPGIRGVKARLRRLLRRVRQRPG